MEIDRRTYPVTQPVRRANVDEGAHPALEQRGEVVLGAEVPPVLGEALVDVLVDEREVAVGRVDAKGGLN